MIAEWERICSLWEREMTVSIAAACHRGERDGGPKIILCTDWRESGLLGSSETAHKQPWLPANWRCLTAGETSEINVIVPMLRKAFHDAGTIDETNVGSIVSESLRTRLAQKRDALSHSRFSKPYQEIYDTGKDKLPAGDFARFIADISALRLEVEFIIAGMVDRDDFLIQTNRRGELSYPNHFSCIGEGAFLAQASLMRRSYTSVHQFGAALYEVYEAKKAAEAVNSVGRQTLLSLLDADKGKTDFKMENLTPFLDRLYGQYGPKGVPLSIDVPGDLFW